MPRPRKPPRLARLTPGGAWYILHHDGIRDRRQNTGCRDDRSAEKFFADWLAARGEKRDPGGPKPPDSLSIAEMLTDWLESHAAAKISAARSAQAAEILLKFWGDDTVADITPERQTGYIAWRRETGKSCKSGQILSNTTIRLEIATLRAACKWAAKHQKLTHAPEFILPEKCESRDRWLTPAEAQMLLTECREPYLKLFVQLALYTGSRKQAILDLRWLQVDFDRDLIRLNPPGRTQTSKRRPPVPIATPLRAALIAAKATANTPWVIELTPQQADRIKAPALAPLGDIKKGFALACRRAGLTDVTPHTLRHTCGSWLAQAGVPMTEIAVWLGHSHTRTTELYAHLSPEHLRGAAAALAEAM